MHSPTYVSHPNIFLRFSSVTNFPVTVCNWWTVFYVIFFKSGSVSVALLCPWPGQMRQQLFRVKQILVDKICHFSLSSNTCPSVSLTLNTGVYLQNLPQITALQFFIFYTAMSLPCSTIVFSEVRTGKTLERPLGEQVAVLYDSLVLKRMPQIIGKLSH